MECKKCLVSIPSEFEFAFSQNICPKCGNKLMSDDSMKMFMDLKKKLQEVEFVMDKNAVCERVAMFLIRNYTVAPIANTQAISTPSPKGAIFPPAIDADNMDKINKFKTLLSEVANDEYGNELVTEEEAIRAEEAARARALAGLDDEDDDLSDTDEFASSSNIDKKVEKLKSLASQGTPVVGGLGPKTIKRVG